MADTDKAWQGTWSRPVKVDAASYDPLTIARMTDHNVRGRFDDEESNRSVASKADQDKVTDFIVEYVEVLRPIDIEEPNEH